MNDENQNNEIAPNQALLEEIRSRKMLGKADQQIIDELASAYQTEQIQRALEALRYMNVTNNVDLETNRPSIGNDADTVASIHKSYFQQTLRVILVLISYHVATFFVGVVFKVVMPGVLMIDSGGSVTVTNIVANSIISILAAIFTYFIFRTKFDLTAYAVLLTVIVFELYRYAAYAIYLAN